MRQYRRLYNNRCLPMITAKQARENMPERDSIPVGGRKHERFVSLYIYSSIYIYTKNKRLTKINKHILRIYKRNITE